MKIGKTCKINYFTRNIFKTHLNRYDKEEWENGAALNTSEANISLLETLKT